MASGLVRHDLLDSRSLSALNLKNSTRLLVRPGLRDAFRIQIRTESVVRTTIRRPRPLVVLAFFALLAVCAPLMAGHIEAVRGKQYGLTKRHGPWMIMVASFNNPPEYERTEGMSPRGGRQPTRL